MTDTAQYAIQVNIKTGPGYEASLINIPANTVEELEAKLVWVTNNPGLVLNAQAALQGTATVARALGATVEPAVTDQQGQSGDPLNAPQGNAPAPNYAPAPQGPPQYSQPAQGAPSCRHGQRQYKEGVSKAGKNYKMWACPSGNRQDQCDPEWVR